MSPHPLADAAVPTHRLEALSDGVYAIALTLLVLDLRVPAMAAGAADRELWIALLALLPRAGICLLTFFLIALFWRGQQRVLRHCAHPDGALVRLELAQLALVSLLPFSNSLMAEHGGRVPAAATYAGHLLALALISWLRVRHVTGHPALLSAPLDESTTRRWRLRARLLVACAAAATGLAFAWPAYNMLAMLPALFVPALAARAPRRAPSA